MGIGELLRRTGINTPVTDILNFDLDAAPVRVDDPLSSLRGRAQKALFERLGSRLFDSSLAEEQLRAYVVQELDQILADEVRQLSPEERHQLVDSIGADIMGPGATARGFTCR